jgi:hypothetical protein
LATAAIASVIVSIGRAMSRIRPLTDASISTTGPAVGRRHALAGAAFAADLLRHARQVVGEAAVLVDDFVEGVGELAGNAFPVGRQLHEKSPSRTEVIAARSCWSGSSPAPSSPGAGGTATCGSGCATAAPRRARRAVG